MNAKNILKKLEKYKYPVLVLLIGLVLILLPSNGSGDSSDDIKLDDELRLENALENCRGVGNATVLISDNGAVIVCDGADNPQVKLAVIKAAESFTGYSSDKIQVLITKLE